MAAQSDWLPLGDALRRLDALAFNAAQEIIGRGEIPIYALRGDLPRSTAPERVEKLLAQATRTFVLGDEIRATYEAGEDIRAILGPRSNMQSENVVAWTYGKAACTVRFHSARVHWPELVAALAAVDCPVSAVDAADAGGPGPKPGEQSVKNIACEIALKILDDKKQRPKPGYGRRIALARLVNTEIGRAYKDDSIARMIRQTVRDWEAKHPRK